ncbi:MAG: DUF3046 domain-containing protein [Jatrophihabitans sp.]
MRTSEFWRRMDARFGPVYARSVAKDYRLPALAATVEEALEQGIEAKDIWRAVCAEFEVPAQLR